MSLVQRIELPKGVPHGAAPAKDPARPVEAAEKPNVSLLRRVRSEHRSPFDFPASSRSAPRPARTPRDPRKMAEEVGSHSIAINLIDEVSQIIPILLQENDDLRAALRTLRQKAEADLEKATLIACEWRMSTEGAKLRIETLELKLAEMTDRAERAELGVQAQRELAHKSSQEAAEAECLSSLFEEKVLASFGAGSLFQTAMDRIRNRTDADLA